MMFPLALLLTSALNAASPAPPMPVGTFVRVEDVIEQQFLTIKPDGSYEMASMNEANLWRVKGALSLAGDLLSLSDPGPRGISRLRVIPWGRMVYLVDPVSLEPFCAFARKAAAAQNTVMEPTTVFWGGNGTKRGPPYPRTSPAACQTKEKSPE
jgi:hypothetical protein